MASGEIIIKAQSLGDAKKEAFKLIGEPSDDIQVYWGKQNWNSQYVTGFECGSSQGRKLFRFDYDKNVGIHINVETGKHNQRQKYSIRFPGTEEDYYKIVTRLTKPDNKNGKEIYANIRSLPENCPI
ncbi:unnamed protein product [Rotaria sp. Silwood1]|nr:unnamed protein product [Rotaria sp. Silwood1]CAF1596773.1 unnamed protein product [Rotaria sp. Silwood1]CAF3781206.1 unnamed protein product [Rotaria sp. Silwood1]